MGISVLESALLACKARKSELSFVLMKLSNSKMAGQNLYSNDLTQIQGNEEYENEQIEMAFDAKVEDLKNKYGDDYTSSSEYTEKYQEYLEDKEESQDKWDKAEEQVKNEYERKEELIDMQEEQTQTQYDAVAANEEGYERNLEKNIENEFRYFD